MPAVSRTPGCNLCGHPTVEHRFGEPVRCKACRGGVCRAPFTGADGPQQTPSQAYRHASDLAWAIVDRHSEVSRSPGDPFQPAMVPIEDVEQLAEGMAVRAEEARRL